MLLEPGFIVGGRYQIAELISCDDNAAVYRAEALAGGAGQVAVKVRRYRPEQPLEAVLAAREELRNEAQMLSLLNSQGVASVPLGLGLVEMYPGDERARRALFPRLDELAREPYLVRAWIAGGSLDSLLRSAPRSHYFSAELGLRLVLTLLELRRAGVALRLVSADQLIVDELSGDLTLVDASQVRAIPDDSPPLPLGLPHLLSGVLSGEVLDRWPARTSAAAEWSDLLQRQDASDELLAVQRLLWSPDTADDALQQLARELRKILALPACASSQLPELQLDGWPNYAGVVLAERYRVGLPWAQGARGRLYSAEDMETGAEVLVKVNRYSYDSAAEFRADLERRRAELEHEFAILRRLSTLTKMLPAPLALVYSRAESPWFELAPQLAAGEPFLVMERISAIPLLEVVEQVRVRGVAELSTFVLRVIRAVSGLLERVHAAGYFLQDLKPDNLLYNPALERLYVVDLASVCPLKPGAGPDAASMAFGAQTHGYAAPEFGEDWRAVDHRFDLYSLGASAWQLLTGVSPGQEARRQGSEYPQLDVGLLAGVDRGLRELVSQLLAPAERRPASAEEVREIAEQLLVLRRCSRLMEPLAPRIDYSEEPAKIRWRRPHDPRVVSVKVKAGSQELGWFSDAVGCVELPASFRAPDTVHLRAYDRSHARASRRLALAFEERPAPSAVEATPALGYVSLQWQLPLYATRAVVRWSATEVPQTPEDGTPAGRVTRGSARVRVGDNSGVYVSVFAIYGGDSSAPRSIQATAWPKPRHPGQLRIEPDPARPRLVWERPAGPAMLQLRQRGGGGAHSLRISSAARAAVLPKLPPSTKWRATWHPLKPDGGSGAPRASLTWRTPPEPPRLAVFTGAGAARVQVAGLQRRWAAAELELLNADGELIAQHRLLRAAADPSRAELALELPPGLSVFRVKSAADGRWPWQAERAALIPPLGLKAGLRLRTRPGMWPPALEIAPPERATEFGHGHRWELVFEAKGESRGIVSPLFQSNKPLIFKDSAAPLGVAGDYKLIWRPALGEPRVCASLSMSSLSWLPLPPAIRPALGAVELSLPETSSYVPAEVSGGSWEVEVDRAGQTELHDAAALPHRLECPGAEPMLVRWRLKPAGAAEPIGSHFSDYRRAAGLVRPPAPAGLMLRRLDRGRLLVWGEPQDRGCVTLIWRQPPSGELEPVYEGRLTQVIDRALCEEGTRWFAQSERHGLLSELVAFSADGAPAQRGAADSSQRAGAVTPRPRVSFVRVAGRAVYQAAGMSGVQEFCLTAGERPSGEVTAVRTSRASPYVVLGHGADAVAGRSLWVRAWPSGRWRSLGRLREVALGWAVALELMAERGVRLSWLEGAEPDTNRLSLVGYSGAKVAVRLSLAATLERWRASALRQPQVLEVGAALAAVSGWLIEHDGAPAPGLIALPRLSAGGELSWAEQLGRDVFVGSQHRALQELAVALGVVIVSERYGLQSLVHGLVGGLPVTLLITMDDAISRAFTLRVRGLRGQRQYPLGAVSGDDIGSCQGWRAAFNELVTLRELSKDRFALEL